MGLLLVDSTVTGMVPVSYVLVRVILASFLIYTEDGEVKDARN